MNFSTYYAYGNAKEKAEAEGKNWDTMGVAAQDEYTDAEMRKAGYERGEYMGAGAWRWNKL